MKIKLLVIDGIAGIQHLELNFNQSINVICGINGIGKTTILDVIADAFNADVTSKLKRNAQCSVGKYKIEIELEAENGKTSDSKEVLIDVFQPDTSFIMEHGRIMQKSFKLWN